jgi:hypothetical protein
MPDALLSLSDDAVARRDLDLPVRHQSPTPRGQIGPLRVGRLDTIALSIPKHRRYSALVLRYGARRPGNGPVGPDPDDPNPSGPASGSSRTRLARPVVRMSGLVGRTGGLPAPKRKKAAYIGILRTRERFPGSPPARRKEAGRGRRPRMTPGVPGSSPGSSGRTGQRRSRRPPEGPKRAGTRYRCSQ